MSFVQVQFSVEEVPVVDQLNVALLLLIAALDGPDALNILLWRRRILVQLLC